MLKLNYLGWELINVHRDFEGWLACYEKNHLHMTGRGKNPEAAVASAQKAVQRKEK